MKCYPNSLVALLKEDHRGIVKFSDKSDSNYLVFTDQLVLLCRNVLEDVAAGKEHADDTQCKLSRRRSTQ